MTNEQIQEKIKSSQQSLTLISMQREGTLRFFHAACYSGDGAEAAKLREQIHVLMDSELDMVASLMYFVRQGAS